MAFLDTSCCQILASSLSASVVRSTSSPILRGAEAFDNLAQGSSWIVSRSLLAPAQFFRIEELANFGVTWDWFRFGRDEIAQELSCRVSDFDLFGHGKRLPLGCLEPIQRSPPDSLQGA